jgi:hypothetical protein
MPRVKNGPRESWTDLGWPILRQGRPVLHYVQTNRHGLCYYCGTKTTRNMIRRLDEHKHLCIKCWKDY